MVKRFVPIPVIFFFLLVACEALSQSGRPSSDLPQRDGSNTLEAQHQDMRTWGSLPDTPSAVQTPKLAEKFQTFVDQARSSLTPGAAGINCERRATERRQNTAAPPPTFSTSYEMGINQEDSLVGKYIFPSSLKQNLPYHLATSSSFMGRATYSASRIFITRNDSGKTSLNTSYFLGILSLVAVHSAYRPYYARSTSAPFSDFGSTIGNDTGMNLFREFGPGIRQVVKSHTPKFALRFGARVTHGPKSKEVVSGSAR